MIDTHCHLNDEKLINEVRQIVEDCKKINVNKLICASYDLQSSKDAVDLSNNFSQIYATIGMHPHDSKLYDDSIEKQFEKLAKNKKVIAFGEIGLDYHYNLSPKNTQIDVFIRQLVLADKLNLPVVIHTREAIGDTYEILKNHLNYLNNGLVIHCYNASKDMTKKFLDFGFKFSFGGPITYNNSNLPELISYMPTDSYFLETDCPYLSPQKLRGQTNYPQNVTIVAEKISQILNKEYKEVEKFTDENACRFFKI